MVATQPSQDALLQGGVSPCETVGGIGMKHTAPRDDAVIQILLPVRRGVDLRDRKPPAAVPAFQLADIAILVPE